MSQSGGFLFLEPLQKEMYKRGTFKQCSCNRCRLGVVASQLEPNQPIITGDRFFFYSDRALILLSIISRDCGQCSLAHPVMIILTHKYLYFYCSFIYLVFLMLRLIEQLY